MTITKLINLTPYPVNIYDENGNFLFEEAKMNKNNEIRHFWYNDPYNINLIKSKNYKSLKRRGKKARKLQKKLSHKLLRKAVSFKNGRYV